MGWSSLWIFSFSLWASVGVKFELNVMVVIVSINEEVFGVCISKSSLLPDDFPQRYSTRLTHTCSPPPEVFRISISL